MARSNLAQLKGADTGGKKRSNTIVRTVVLVFFVSWNMLIYMMGTIYFSANIFLISTNLHKEAGQLYLKEHKRSANFSIFIIHWTLWFVMHFYLAP